MDTEDRYEDSDDMKSQHWMLKIGATMAVLVALVGLAWVLAETPRPKNLTYGGARLTSNAEPEQAMAVRTGDQPHPARVVGTSGALAAGGTGGGFEAAEPIVIQELETITGNVDGSELVGRKVDLHVPVLQDGNPVTFWIGTPDNRLLVVLHRDVRDGSARQQSLPPAHGILTVQEGQQAVISGTIQMVPPAEDRYSWNLTREQTREVEARRIYLRADSVRSEGHGE